MEYRYMPPIAKLLSIVDSGALGRLHMIHIREHRFPFLLKVADWNRFSKFTGGTLVEKCCHFWDLMRRIIGPDAEALRVFASGGMDVNHKDERYFEGQVTPRRGVGVQMMLRLGADECLFCVQVPDIVDNAFVVVEFAGGVRACLDLCMFAEDRQHEEVSVVGATGKVHAEAPACVVTHHTPTQRAAGAVPLNSRVPPAAGTYEANTVVEETSVDGALLEAGFHEGATYFELAAMVDAVRRRSVAAVSAYDGTAAVAIGVAAETSIRLGRMVTLDEVMAEGEAARQPQGAETTAGAGGKRPRLSA
jgi:predicted dehydrogenase